MRRPVRNSLLVIVFLSLLPGPTRLLAMEQLVVDVYLNTVFKGQFFGYVSGDRKDFFLTAEDLHTLGLDLEGSTETIDDTSYVSIRSLQPQVSHVFREDEIALYLTAAPDLLGTALIDLQRRAPEGTVALSANSAFLNYSLIYSADDSFGYDSLYLPLETGIRWHDLLFFSNLNYSDDDQGDQLTRLFSNIVKDDTAALRRYTFGDYNASSGELGGGATMGGLKISKNYSLNPYFLRSPGLSFQGQLQTPADVELWRNGSLLATRELGPGNFEFQNIPGLTGAGEADLIIRDAFGEEQHITYPFYFSSSLLQQGLHEYDYNLGFKRKEFGSESFSYGGPALVASHRYGFSNAWTGGVRGEFAEHVASAGVTSGYIIGRYGLISLAASASKVDGRTGQAASLGYSYSGAKYLSGYLTYRMWSREYGNLSIGPDDDKARSDLLASTTLNMGSAGNLNLFYNDVDMYSGEDRKRLTVRYTKNLTRRLNCEVSASKIKADNNENQFFVSLNYFFGNGISVYASVSKTDGDENRSLTVQRSPYGRLGTGYRLQATSTARDEGDTTERYDAEVTRYTQYGDYTARVQSNDSVEAYLLRATGSLSTVNGSYHLGPRLNDAFAVVKIAELEGVEVARSNSPVGKTDSSGEVLVPGLISNYANKLSFNKQSLPLDYQYDTNEKYVSLPYRGGAYVELPVKKLQSVIGRLFVRDQQGSNPAELWLLQLSVDGAEITAPVGRGGDFYLEELPPGSYPATLVKGQANCSMTMVVPESDEILNDIGDIYCEMD